MNAVYHRFFCFGKSTSIVVRGEYNLSYNPDLVKVVSSMQFEQKSTRLLKIVATVVGVLWETERGYGSPFRLNNGGECNRGVCI